MFQPTKLSGDVSITKDGEINLKNDIISNKNIKNTDKIDISKTNLNLSNQFNVDLFKQTSQLEINNIFVKKTGDELIGNLKINTIGENAIFLGDNKWKISNDGNNFSIYNSKLSKNAINIDENNNIGIGIEKPSEAIDIVGNVKTKGNINNTGDIITTGKIESNTTITDTINVGDQLKIDSDNSELMEITNKRDSVFKITPDTISSKTANIDISLLIKPTTLAAVLNINENKLPKIPGRAAPNLSASHNNPFLILPNKFLTISFGLYGDGLGDGFRDGLFDGLGVLFVVVVEPTIDALTPSTIAAIAEVFLL